MCFVLFFVASCEPAVKTLTLQKKNDLIARTAVVALWANGQNI